MPSNVLERWSSSFFSSNGLFVLPLPKSDAEKSEVQTDILSSLSLSIDFSTPECTSLKSRNRLISVRKGSCASCPHIHCNLGNYRPIRRTCEQGRRERRLWTPSPSETCYQLGLFLPSRLAASSIGDRLNKEIASFGGGNFFVEIVEKSRCLQYIFLFVLCTHFFSSPSSGSISLNLACTHAKLVSLGLILLLCMAESLQLATCEDHRSLLLLLFYPGWWLQQR